MEKSTPRISRSLIAVTIAVWVVCFNLQPLGRGAELRAETSGEDLDQVLSQVKKREKTLLTFVARFKQTRQSAMFMEPLVSEGSMYFDRTGKILMKVTGPQPLILLITDNRLIMGNPDTGRFTQKSIPGRQSIAERYLGIGQSAEALKSRYDIHAISPGGATGYHLRLTPKKPSQRLPFESIEVGINRQLWLPEYIRLDEAGGDHTVITLEYQSINAPLPKDIFSFELPQKGTDR